MKQWVLIIIAIIAIVLSLYIADNQGLELLPGPTTEVVVS